MMSSEEDTECYGLYGDKLLKKAKRTRQRVDAGEPRNSYSSIPNFSSRPSFVGGGLYGAIFNSSGQPQSSGVSPPQKQHFGAIFSSTSPPCVSAVAAAAAAGTVSGFAPAAMLNELLGRQMKAADAAADISMIGSDNDPKQQPLLNGAANFEATMLRNEEVDNAHMLRDILQGRKKELMALEQELRAVSGGGDGRDFSVSPTNNNNNEIKSGEQAAAAAAAVGGEQVGATGGVVITGSSAPTSPTSRCTPAPATTTEAAGPDAASERDTEEEEEIEEDEVTSDASDSAAGKLPRQQGTASQQPQQEMDGENSDSYHSDSSRGSNTSLVHIKEEDMIMDEDLNSPNPSQTKDSSSKPQPTESVELKRARVENIVSSMRSSPSLPVQVNGCKKRKLYHPQQHESARYVLEEDEEDAPVLKQKRVEKDALKSQLRTMQEQLAEMQQKYVQLCNRMELESDCQDENTGDMSMEIASASAMAAAAAAAAQAEELLEKTPVTNPAAAAAAAAAMYLGVGHKMFLEQEAQRLKEAGVEHPHQHPQLPPHHPHHHPGNQGGPSGSGGGHQPPQGPQHHHPCPPPPHHHHHPSSHQLAVAAAAAAKNAEFNERFPFFRNGPPGAGPPITGADLEGLAEVLKSEMSASLSMLIDSILTRFVQQRRFLGKQTDAAAAEQLNKDLILASQLLDRKSPRTKVIDRGPNNNPQPGGGGNTPSNNNNPGTSNNSGNGHGCGSTAARVNGTAFPINLASSSTNPPPPPPPISSSLDTQHLPPHLRPPVSMASMFQPPKPPCNSSSSSSTPVATAAAMPGIMSGAGSHAAAVVGPASSALYSMGSLAGSNPFCHMNPPDQPPAPQQPSPQQQQHRAEREMPEQNEALSLVVTAKKKRHKVTDTRITPRTVSRILSQDSGPPPPGTPNSCGGATPGPMMDPKYGSLVPTSSAGGMSAEPRGGAMGGKECPSPLPYHPPPPPMLPVSLPTSVAIPNPGLHESQVFSPYSPFYGQHHSSSPPDRRDAESPIGHPPSLLHPALLAAHGTPDYGHMRPSAPNSATDSERGMDCNSADSPYDSMQPTLSFSNARLTSPVRDSGKKSIRDYLSLLKQESLGSLNEPYSSTLTPMHLRKAKLMFFWVRYPSSAVLKMYFPDIKFNKNNTAQLVKWFSNFREFYYIQMEKYARQSITEGVKNADDIHVSGDCEIYRVLNLHYNRNNHIEVPSNFRFVVEQTLREFFKAIQTGKDTEQSWKKSIYKVISRLDDPVPEYFKSPNFLEQLE